MPSMHSSSSAVSTRRQIASLILRFEWILLAIELGGLILFCTLLSMDITEENRNQQMSVRPNYDQVYKLQGQMFASAYLGSAAILINFGLNILLRDVVKKHMARKCYAWICTRVGIFIVDIMATTMIIILCFDSINETILVACISVILYMYRIWTIYGIVELFKEIGDHDRSDPDSERNLVNIPLRHVGDIGHM